MFLFVCLCVKSTYVCLYIFVYISTKVKDIDSSLDKNIILLVIQRMSDKLDKLVSNMTSMMKIYDVS